MDRPKNISKFVANAMFENTVMTDLNRIEIIFVEKKRTNRWLAQQLGKVPVTVSRWCTNVSQPDLLMMNKIAITLDVDVR